MSNTIDSAISRTADRSVEQAAHPTATDNRAQIERAIRTTKDREDLKGLVALYILDATRNDAIPGDRLRSIEKQVRALRPGDTRFSQVVRDVGEGLTELWDRQGLTSRALGELLTLSRKPDWAGVKAAVTNQLKTLVTTSPTIEAVQSHKHTFLAHGPQKPEFKKAVEDAVNELITTGPANAASEIARVLGGQGPDAAARKLRELTDPEKTTPLQAALILKEAKPTIDSICRICQIIPGSNGIEFRQGPNGPFRRLSLVAHQQMFRDLCAAVDSAGRSREAAAPTIEQIAGALCLSPFANDVKKSVADGNLVLPLEMLKQLRGSHADRLSGQIKDGLAELRASVEQSVREFAKTVLPLQNPAANWNALLPSGDGQPFKTPEQTAKQWLAAHHNFIDQAHAKVKDLDLPGYRMTRATLALNDYLPQLPPSNDANEMRKLVDVPEMSPIAFAQVVSRMSWIELTRAGNTKGLGDIPPEDPNEIVAKALGQFSAKGPQGLARPDPHKIVPDPSWSARAGRNFWQQMTAWRSGGSAPFSIGLSLYGTGTYLVGVNNQTTEQNRNAGDREWEGRRGWRVKGYKGMYVVGTGIEGVQVGSQVLSKVLKLDLSNPDAAANGLKRFLANTAANNPSSLWPKLFSLHLVGFGVFNVIGSAAYFKAGDWQRGTAIGVAGGGTLLSSLASRALWGSRALAWAGPVGTALAFAGSAVSLYLNLRDQERLARETEPYNEAYLITAGLKPEIAKALAKNDRDGLSTGPKLEQLAKYLGVAPQKLLQYLNDQDPRWVGDFVEHGLHAVAAKPNQQGRYPWEPKPGNLRAREGITGWTSPALRTDPSLRPEFMFANTLEGIVEWAALSGHKLPGR